MKTRIAWNKGHLLGQKPALKVDEIRLLRAALQQDRELRDLALLNLAIDSKLRGCDLLAVRLRDVCQNGVLRNRAVVMQRKSQKPVQFEITAATREALSEWIGYAGLGHSDHLFPGRAGDHLSTRQYSRIVKGWVSRIGLDPSIYGTHSLRRTKVTLIYKQTKDIRAVQLLLGHTKLESTIRYLGMDVEDAIAIAERTEIA